MPRPLYEYLDSESNPTEIEVEEEEGESSEVAVTTSTSSTSYSVIKWCGGRKKTPVVSFSAHVLLLGLQPEQRQIAEKYHLAYKFVKTECKLVRSILNSHCFREVHPNSPNFNLMWTGSHLKPHTLRGMQDFQKVNHFPRSYELTRKDRLYKNVQRLQHLKGYKHFDFIPNSFVLPEEYNEFYSAFMKDKGPWIVKPVASSRGRGIYLTTHPSQVPLDENLLICKYISNPLLIDGFKFDVRLYVGVTSYDPLRIYLYEEGLTRFATVKYDKSVRNIGNTCMHLTNYSVNKKSENFVSCQDPEVEDYGNKWSMSAMLRYLKEKGRDTAALMMRVEDVIIKTIIAGELPIASACKMFMPHPGNCFEIYGFDILIDERLRPWLLEVNLSPSLACESPLDLKIKSHLITDMFNLVGYIAHDPLIRRNPIRRVPDYSPSNKTYQKQRTMSAGPVLSSTSLRPSSSRKKIDEALTLTSEEMRILRQTNEEYDRRGGFVRIFPSSESWELYGSFLEHRTTHNQMIHTKLFPGRKASIHRPTTASLSSATARAKNLTTYGTSLAHSGTTVEPSEPSIAGQEELSITSRISCYERKLDSWSPAILQSRSTENVQSNSTVSLDHPASSHSLAKLQDNRLEIQGQTEVNTDQPRPQEGPGRSQSQVTLETQGSAPVMYAPRPRVQSAKEARPPRPQGSHETVSKRVLSAQPTFKAIRVEDIMDKSGALTKLQARQAFAMYLQRVQQRLIYEANYDSDDSTDSTRQDEQMSLVIRFLKKAAGNLQQPFKVVIPSRKLPLHDRRRILAKQLGDFVHVYGKETNQIQKRQEISRTYGLNRNTNNDSEIPDEDFKIFMAIASETELEDLLTRYTKLNKSASVFLGGSPDKVKEDDIGTANHVETGLNRRKEPETTLRGHLRSKSNGAQEESGWARPREEYDPPNNPSVIERHNRALTTVSAYGTSVALNKTKRRPASAKISSTQGTEKTRTMSRPFSAKVSRDRNTTDDSEDSTAQRKGYQKANEQAVALALQKLAKRQSARQYSPLTTTATTSTNWRDILSQLDQNADQDLTKPRDDDYANRTTKQDANDSRGYHVKDSLKSRDRHASANATFNSFVDYDRDDSDERFARNAEVETAMHQHARTHPSQWRTIRVELPKEHDEQSLKEDRLEEKERKPPLELKGSVSREDYNRHIQLLSQKLSETKLSFNQAQHPCLPRPPPGPSPARKIINAKRMARLASSHYDQGAVTKQQDTACKLTNGYT